MYKRNLPHKLHPIPTILVRREIDQGAVAGIHRKRLNNRLEGVWCPGIEVFAQKKFGR